MKFYLAFSHATALLALAGSVEAVGHAHRHGHGHHHRSRHQHHDIHAHSADMDISIEKRGGHCKFPTDAGLVAVTPDKQNAGWAMSPNQPCLPGNYCPYACPPGQVSMQWDPKATSYSYPMSMVSLMIEFICMEEANICCRMGVFIAIKTVRSRNHSLINHIARTALELCLRRINVVMGRSHSVRLCCLVTRRC